MSMFLNIVAALLAWGMAAAWVLTGGGGDRLPPEWDHLRTGSPDKIDVDLTDQLSGPLVAADQSLAARP